MFVIADCLVPCLGVVQHARDLYGGGARSVVAEKEGQRRSAHSPTSEQRLLR